MAIESFLFDSLDGRPVEGFVLSAGGLEATLVAHGARLVRMLVPGRDGPTDQATADVVLGFDRLADYLESDAYFGATCGRYGNRIGGAAFALDGVQHALAANEPPNQLHGGPEGFDRRLWGATVEEADNAVTFTLVSPDGDQGYPGTLTATARYRLTDDGVLDILMTAATDRPTVVNLVHHSYWNLGGHASGDLRGHRLAVRGGFVTPVGADLIPTGEVRPVGGTAFDLRGGVGLGDALEAVGGLGFDHNWCLEGPAGELRPVAWLEHPASGRRMELATDQPGLQVYTGGYLSDGVVGKGGQPYRRFAGLALESQRFPGSPNIGHFPSARLDPGETYRHRMQLRFRTG